MLRGPFQRSRVLRKVWSNHSFLSERHFSGDFFQPFSAMAPTMGISWRKKLNPDANPTIFERPEPTDTLSVASDSGDAATFSQKRTTATANNSTFVTDSHPKRPRKAYEKIERAWVTRTKMVNYCKQAGNVRARLHRSGCPHQTPLRRKCCRKTKMMNTKGLIH